MSFTPNCNPYISILSNCSGYIDLAIINDYVVVIDIDPHDEPWITKFKVVEYRHRAAARCYATHDKVEDAIEHACELAGVSDPEHAERDEERYRIEESLEQLKDLRDTLDEKEFSVSRSKLKKKLQKLKKEEFEVLSNPGKHCKRGLSDEEKEKKNPKKKDYSQDPYLGGE